MDCRDKSAFNSLILSAGKEMKAVAKCTYIIYENDYYKLFGCSSFYDFVSEFMEVGVRVAQWYVRLWHTVEKCKKAGHGWVEGLSWGKLMLIWRMSPSQIESLSSIQDLSYSDAANLVRGYERNAWESYKMENPASGEIRKVLAPSGAIDPGWMCQWLRENREIVSRFLDEEC